MIKRSGVYKLYSLQEIEAYLFEAKDVKSILYSIDVKMELGYIDVYDDIINMRDKLENKEHEKIYYNLLYKYFLINDQDYNLSEVSNILIEKYGIDSEYFEFNKRRKNFESQMLYFKDLTLRKGKQLKKSISKENHFYFFAYLSSKLGDMNHEDDPKYDKQISKYFLSFKDHEMDLVDISNAMTLVDLSLSYIKSIHEKEIFTESLPKYFLSFINTLRENFRFNNFSELKSKKIAERMNDAAAILVSFDKKYLELFNQVREETEALLPLSYRYKGVANSSNEDVFKTIEDCIKNNNAGMLVSVFYDMHYSLNKHDLLKQVTSGIINKPSFIELDPILQDIVNVFNAISRFVLGDMISLKEISTSNFRIENYLDILIEYAEHKIDFLELKNRIVKRKIKHPNVHEFVRSFNILKNEDLTWVLVYLSSIETDQLAFIDSIFEQFINMIQHDKISMVFQEFTKNANVIISKSSNFKILVNLLQCYQTKYYSFDKDIEILIDKILSSLKIHDFSKYMPEETSNGLIYNISNHLYTTHNNKYWEDIAFIIKKYKLQEVNYLLPSIHDESILISNYDAILKNVFEYTKQDFMKEHEYLKGIFGLFHLDPTVLNRINYLEKDLLIYQNDDFCVPKEVERNKYHEWLGYKDCDICDSGKKSSLIVSLVASIFFRNPKLFGLTKISLDKNLDAIGLIKQLDKKLGGERLKELQKEYLNTFPSRLLSLGSFNMYSYLKEVKHLVSESDVSNIFKGNKVNFKNYCLDTNLKKIIHPSSIMFLASINALKVLDNPSTYISGECYYYYAENATFKPVDFSDGITTRKVYVNDLVSEIFSKLQEMDQSSRVLYSTYQNLSNDVDYSNVPKFDLDIFKIIIDKNNDINYVVTEDKFYFSTTVLDANSSSTFSLIYDSFNRGFITPKEFVLIIERLTNIKYFTTANFPSLILKKMTESNDETLKEVIKALNKALIK